MSDLNRTMKAIQRREFLKRSGGGFGMLALSSLLNSGQALGTTVPVSVPKIGKAKSVIWLFMNGGPSGLDLFSHKPALEKWHDKRFPGSIETLFPHPGPIMKSPFKFQRHGESGLPVSELYPNIAKHVDDIAFLNARSCHSHNHVPACYMVNCGISKIGAPCLGSWASYGLGSGNEDLPSFVVMYDHRTAPEGGANLWDAAYLPGENQGVPFRASEQPILYLNRDKNISSSSQQKQLAMLQKMNRWHANQNPNQQELLTRINSFETAFKMQMTAPKIVDTSNETAATKNLYGIDVEESKTFGTQLLMARKMAEQGVRFIQIYHGGYKNNWDSHGGLEKAHRGLCRETDQPIAGLLQDLKQRGLLDETLVIWGGEFGRTPTSQDKNGRDHNPYGFTMWMAGGGVKPGIAYGETDELGYKPVENEVTMHDLHATVLHLLGLDHEALTHRFGGREQSLVNGLGHVIKDLIA